MPSLPRWKRHIFLSYCHKDVVIACKVKAALEASGLPVWWDEKVLAAEVLDPAIAHAIETAEAVVVLWSTASILSDWVKHEASLAKSRKLLFGVCLDTANPPEPYGGVYLPNLAEWNGTHTHPEFDRLLRAIARVRRVRRARLGVPAIIACAAIILVAVKMSSSTEPRTDPTQSIPNRDAAAASGPSQLNPAPIQNVASPRKLSVLTHLSDRVGYEIGVGGFTESIDTLTEATPGEYILPRPLAVGSCILANGARFSIGRDMSGRLDLRLHTTSTKTGDIWHIKLELGDDWRTEFLSSPVLRDMERPVTWRPQIIFSGTGARPKGTLRVVSRC